MKTIEFDTQFGDKPVHIEVSAPLGAGRELLCDDQ